jgi:hypothetical protein
LAAHEQGDAHRTIVADDRDPRRSAVFHDMEQRNEAVGRKIHMPLRAALFVDSPPERHRHKLQVRQQALVVRRRQCSKQPVHFASDRRNSHVR